MKVEQALRLLPPHEALIPLRTQLLSSARADDRAVWASSGAYLTVGKRDVETGEMRRRMGRVLHQITEHLTGLYAAYVEALEFSERGDHAGAVSHLVRAGMMEESAGRLEHARSWFAAALTLAEGLQDRRPEVEALLSMGRATMALGSFEEAARHYQRALVLAEAELDEAGAMIASEGLGNVADEQAPWGAGARAWYARGMRLAESVGDQRRIGELHRALAESARRAGQFSVASDELKLARAQFENLGDAREMARVLTLQGMVEADLGETAQAAGSYREALAWARRAEPDAGLEVFIRMNFARLHLEAGRYLEAEEETRRAEQLAIAGNLIRQLVEVYSLLGTTRGRQGDETGFVFFEEAIELVRMLDHSPLVEAQVCYEYGVFQHRVARPDESKAYLERALEIFESVGASGEVRRVSAELERFSA